MTTVAQDLIGSQYSALSTSYTSYDRSYTLGTSYSSSAAVALDAVALNLPVGQAAQPALSATVARSYTDDFYNRFHITPKTLSLGTLVSTQQVAVSVWNAHFTSQTVNSITASNLPGITNDSTTPQALAPLVDYEFTVTVPVEGQPEIDGSYVFDTTDGQLEMPVTGSRALFFGFAPNWAGDVVEHISYKTHVFTSDKGSEKRSSLRVKPRRSFELSYLCEQEEARTFDRYLFAWSEKLFALPVWHERDFLTAELTAGATSIPINPNNKSYAAGKYVCLWRNYNDYELLEIDALSSSIELSQSTASTWPVGTQVVPVVSTRLIDSPNTRRLTDSALGARLNFNCLPGEPVNLPTLVSVESFKGVEVLTEQPNWAGDIVINIEKDRRLVDFGVGAVDVISLEDEARNIRRYTWLTNDADEINRWRSIVGMLFGRRNPIWIPSWHSDYDLAQPVSDTDPNITLVAADHKRLLSSFSSKRYLMFLHKNGTRYYREITGYPPVENNPGEEQVTLNAALGINAQPSDFIMICNLWFCRAASDDFYFTYCGDSICKPALSFMSIQAEV